MKIKTQYFDIKIDFLFIIVLFIFFLSEKIRIFLTPFFSCYLFILFHELSHMLVASIFGREVNNLHISISGVSISFCEEKFVCDKKKNTSLKKIQNIIIYLAGPLANFLLAIIFYRIKMIFEINMFLGSLNLLSIYPLDGYNIFENIISLMKLSEIKVKLIINITSNILLFILLLIGITIIVKYRNPSVIIFLVYLFLLKQFKNEESKKVEMLKNISY